MTPDLKNRFFFISYSHLDKELIAPYLREMQDRSLALWYDRFLHPGRVFSDEIAQSISDCSLFILFLSANSAQSWYVADELTYARNQRKPVVLVHLDPDSGMQKGMELLTGNLHQIRENVEDVKACVDQIEYAFEGGQISPSEPISEGLMNHSSELLKSCRKEFVHIASQMGVTDIDASIDPDFFCPITAAGASGKREEVDLRNEIARDDHTHILLQADGGLGKTYTILYTMNLLLKCDRPCAYIPCHLFTGNDRDEDEELGPILKMLCLMYLPSTMRTEAGLNRYFTSQTDKAFILFLDGFNEAVIKNRLSRELVHISSTFPNIKIVVSSRSFDPAFAAYGSYTMRGLGEQSVREILRAHGRDYDSLDLSLRKILMTPMFLRLYIRMGRTDREIDTAAELMDQERERIRNIVQLSESDEWSSSVEECLDRVFPDFVRKDYCEHNRQLSFFGKQLEDCLKESFGDEKTAEQLFGFLVENSVIMKGDGRTGKYAYRHEHFRDYWVACSVFRSLAGCLEQPAGAERAGEVIRLLDRPYSDIVLQYIGELSQIHLPDTMLLQVLDCLRRRAVGDDGLWSGTETAEATSKLIRIFKLCLEDDLVGMDLSELNLSRTLLNQARTCTRRKKAAFRGSLITEDTFIVSLHESAPRHVEILCLEDRHYLVTVSNHDLLVSTLPGLETVWRYPHTDADGKHVATRTLVSGIILGSCLMAVDTGGNVWEWDFFMQGKAPSVSPLRLVGEAERAVKVFPWSDPYGALIGLLLKDGSIQQYAPAADPDTGISRLKKLTAEYGLNPPAEQNDYCTLAASPDHTCLYWAAGRDDGIHIRKYSLDIQLEEEICHIPETGLEPNYLACAGTEQASRENAKLDFGASAQDGNVLILSAICGRFTRVYQVNLPRTGAGKTDYCALVWPDGSTELENHYEKTQRPDNRINSSSFAGGKLILGANDGCVYQFTWEASERRYVPAGAAARSRIADTAAFAVEDVLYLPEDTVAAVSVDRCVHLLDGASLTLIKKHKGYNDGLRRLLPERDSLLMVTSYDGNVLELARTGNRFTCADKIPVGDWAWSLEKISGSVWAVGYGTGVALIDKAGDTVLSRLPGSSVKVEDLLYLPDVGNLLLAADKTGVRTIRLLEEADGGMRMEETGHLALPDKTSCFWLRRKDSTLYASVSGEKDDCPRIACFDLRKPLAGQQPAFIETGLPYGRIRDFHFLGSRIIVSGPCAEKSKGSTARVCFIDISPSGEQKVSRILDGFESYIVHSALQETDGVSRRFAVIDSQGSGKLYQFTLEEKEGGSLSVTPHSCCVFHAVLCDVAFDSRGDLLITSLDGGLYAKPWDSETPQPLFCNKSHMLTFGADMSSLYRPVSPGSRLGRILSDFGNRLNLSGREFSD